MDRKVFNELFDYLDAEISKKGCNHTLKLTDIFLTENRIESALLVKDWLSENGGYCDCEVLANVEEKFE